jgi:glycosyltransferase involved in cell wall biosynthesis
MQFCENFMEQKIKKQELPKSVGIQVPLLSVVMITYNHELYIAQALDNILNQETDFSFEVIIGDDCSTDRTLEIVNDYKKRFPEVIKVLCREINIGFQVNFKQTLLAGEGKYLAVCEGDDYWTDPCKLQKQVKFLENNSDYVMSAHSVNIVDNNGNCIKNAHPYTPIIKDKSHFQDILKYHFIPTLSLVFRRVITTIPDWFQQIRSCDIALELMLASHGKCFYFHETMGAYRKHPGGVTNVILSPAELYRLDYSLYEGVNLYTQGQYQSDITRKLAMVDYLCARRLMNSGDHIKAIELFKKALSKDFLVFLKVVVNKIKIKIYRLLKY